MESDLKWFKHPVFKSDIYSEGGLYRIVGRRLYGNEFEYQPAMLVSTTYKTGLTVEGWKPLGRPTNLEEAKRQCNQEQQAI